MIPSKFTLEELRGFKRLAKLPVEALELLAFRLDKLDARYHHDPTVTHVEIGLDPHLHRLRPGHGLVVGPLTIPIEKEPEHHRWHDLARQLDGAFREAIPSRWTTPLAFWAVKKITGDQMVTLPGVKKALQRQAPEGNQAYAGKGSRKYTLSSDPRAYEQYGTIEYRGRPFVIVSKPGQI